jgi:hypothetical protein
MLHCVPEELEDQLNASLRGLYSVYQTWHKGHAVYRLRSNEPPCPSTYSAQSPWLCQWRQCSTA